jgi:hypothetical protein
MLLGAPRGNLKYQLIWFPLLDSPWKTLEVVAVGDSFIAFLQNKMTPSTASKLL